MSVQDLKYAVDKLNDARPDIVEYQDYYEGDQPLVYSTARLREIFGQTSLVRYIENWCAVVVDAALDRISFKGWSGGQESVTKALTEFYVQEDLKVEADDIHRDALVTGHGYAIFDIREDGTKTIIHNDPTNVYAVYSNSDPDVMMYALKVWEESDYEGKGKAIRANLYYPDVIEKYVSIGSQGLTGAAWKLVDGKERNNPFGRIPVIHFRSAKEELKDIISLQNAINKLFADMMITADFNAFPQRYAVTNTRVDDLKASAQSLWRIPKGMGDEESTQLGEFSAAELTRFTQAMEKLTNSIFVVSRTPKHYLLNTGANVSGEALLAMEAPLVAKVQKHIDRFSSRWEDVARVVTGNDSSVISVWNTPETRLKEHETKMMAEQKKLGLPLKTILRRAGWTETEIQQMLEDKKEESKQSAELQAQAFSMAQQRLAQENNPIA